MHTFRDQISAYTGAADRRYQSISDLTQYMNDWNEAWPQHKNNGCLSTGEETFGKDFRVAGKNRSPRLLKRLMDGRTIELQILLVS